MAPLCDGLPATFEDALWHVAEGAFRREWLTPRALASAGLRLSACYTVEREAMGRAAEPSLLPARLLFFGPSDAVKVFQPLAELLCVRPLPRCLRILDLGAGTGAMTVGILAFLERLAIEKHIRAVEPKHAGGLQSREELPACNEGLGLREVEIVAADRDAQALVLLEKTVEAIATRHPALRPTVATSILDLGRVLPFEAALGKEPFDLVVMGSVLNELFPEQEHRDEAVAQVVLRAAELMRPSGAVLIIEPALRDIARDLARLRERLIREGLVLFAPCTHTAGCPMLERERDWCHEAKRVVLPPRCAAIARQAAMRFSEARFSYLTVVRHGPTLAEARSAPWRVVSHPLRSKGVLGMDLCGLGRRVRVELLRRDRGTENAAWDSLERGDLVAFEPPLAFEPHPEGRRVRLEPGQVVRAVPAPWLPG